MRLPFVLLLLVSLFTACTDDVVEETPVAERLLGRWDLMRASRNNVETTTLGSLFYDFGPDGVLGTNLLGEEQTGTYTLADDATRVITAGVKLPLEYTIVQHSDTTLHLRARHEGYLFDFELLRGER